MPPNQSEKPLRVYFLGAGEIAVPVLDSLRKSFRTVTLCGVGTQVDRPAGRKLQLQPTPVALFCASCAIAVDKIPDINAPEMVAKLRALNLDFLVVVSFGQLLKQEVLELPRIDCVNVHASLLPRYRGASPIVHAILNGDRECGVSYMQMVRALDAGKVYRQLTMPLSGTETADTLEMALGELAGRALPETLRKIASGELTGQEQAQELVTVTRKIKKSQGALDFRKSAAALDAQIRAFYAWPTASFELPMPQNSVRLGVRACRIRTDFAPGSAPGTILQADRKGFVIACGKDALELLEVVPPGKKPMRGVEFLNGCRSDLAAVCIPLPEPESALATELRNQP